MDEKRKFEYIKIPVSMITLLYDGWNGFHVVICYCLCRTSEEMDFDSNNVAKRIVYEAMLKEKGARKVEFPAIIENFLERFASSLGVNELSDLDDGYRGFYPDQGGDFNPETLDNDHNEVNIIDEVNLEFQNNPHLWDAAVHYYRLGQLANLMKIKLFGTDEIINIREQYKWHDKCKAWAWVKLDKLAELHNKRELQDDDIEKYAAFLAMKSIIGKNKVGRAESKLILARMLGFVKSEECDRFVAENNDESLVRIFKKYSNKENFRRLMGLLRDGYVKYIETIPGKNRLGLFFSFTRDLPKYSFEEEVMKIVEADKKEKAKIKKRMQRRKKRTGCRPAKGIDLKAHQAPPGLPF